MFIGRIENGTTAMAALSVSLPLITCITAFTRLVGIGGAPLCAIKMGKKDQRGAEEILGVSFASLITVGVILTVVILVFQRPILTLFGADPTTLDMACDYVSIYALGTVFVMISLGMNSYITTQGFARTGMCTVLIGAILNIIFVRFSSTTFIWASRVRPSPPSSPRGSPVSGPFLFYLEKRAC